MAGSEAQTARGLAWRTLVRVERDAAYADLVLGALLRESELSRRDRAFATELAYGALRQRGRLDAALAQVMDRPLDKAELGVRNLLRLGAYQILFLDRVRPATAVDETVKLARAGHMSRASGFVNAVLRRVAERGGQLVFPDLEEDPIGWLEQVGSLPSWLADRWLARFGAKEASQLARALAEPPPRTVRLSPGADRAALSRRLGARPCEFAPDGLTDLRSDPVRDPAFLRGELTVQDEASQLVALLVGAQVGASVVDCCAAPGTKTVQLAQQVGPTGEVIALELHESRLPLIRRAAQRMGVKNLRILQRDVTQGFDLRGRLRFAHILLDAPCSGLGVLRRNPDARWRVQEEDVFRCAETQARMLATAARYLESGGGLVYSVCTFTPEETDRVIAGFLEAHADFRLDDPRPFLPASAKSLVGDDLALRTWPHRHGCDAFYAVRLVRL